MTETTNRPPSGEARPAQGDRPPRQGAPSGERRPGGPQGGDRRGGPQGRGGPRGKKKFYYRKRKFCKFKAEKIDYIDFKDVELLRSFTPERGKIAPRRQTGTSAKFQRMLATAIKRARHIALLPYTTD
ncbi:30S ribosomal protein S18 [Acanthopleuribacter pedis]|uniref:Small ribosomal subunit protein bS18 n=1 Tax=Acanthopleuribacter pedis TaxID=442870 RepID=A0A8J7QGX2_9BACT|nr:30S ribosomal protein S18 [Acanthopleuribacter pedis]